MYLPVEDIYIKKYCQAQKVKITVGFETDENGVFPKNYKNN
jgi:hypothetical protein